MSEETMPEIISDVWAKYWKAILACALLGALVAGMWVQVRPGTYTARAELMTGTYTLGPEVQSVAALADAGALGLELPANSQAQLIDSPATANKAAAILEEDYPTSIPDLVDLTQVSALTDNSFAIESTATSAEVASARANAMAQGYLEVRADKGRQELAKLAAGTGLDDEVATDLKAQSRSFDGGGVIYRPALATEAQGPLNSTIVILFGAACGGVLGIVIALISRMFAKGVRTERDLIRVMPDALVLSGKNSDLVLLRSAAMRNQPAGNRSNGPLRLTLISATNPEMEREAAKVLNLRLSGHKNEWRVQLGSDPANEFGTALGAGNKDFNAALGIPVVVVEKGKISLAAVTALRNQLAQLGNDTIALMLLDLADNSAQTSTVTQKAATPKTSTSK